LSEAKDLSICAVNYIGPSLRSGWQRRFIPRTCGTRH